jgi:hypothetical protein
LTAAATFVTRVQAPTRGDIVAAYDASMKRAEKTGLGDYADANSAEAFAQASAAYFGIGYYGEQSDKLKELNPDLYGLSERIYGPAKDLSVK